MKRWYIILILSTLLIGGVSIALFTPARIQAGKAAEIPGLHHTSSPRVSLAPETAVAVFSPRTGQWVASTLAQVPPGSEFRYQQAVYRLAVNGQAERLSAIRPEALTEADRPFTPEQYRWPEATDIVQVLDDDLRVTRHAVLSELIPGIRICFQGKVYALREVSGPGRLALVDTGMVSARVTETFSHAGSDAAETLLDVTVRAADGSTTILHATPNHPFYVPDRKVYVELGELKPGTRLLTADRGEATIVAMNTRQGKFDVYNLEVEGPHNYYVGDQRVLVHNKAMRHTPTPEIPRLDGSGKVHGDIPDHIPDAWTREELEELEQDLMASIRRRESLMKSMGEDAAHRARLGQEYRLLRQIRKKLYGKW